MWQLAEQQNALRVADFAVGSLIVFRRNYTIKNKKTVIPGHIGIVTKTKGGIDVIHANIKSGRVEEEPIERIGAPMGCLAINLFNTEERYV